MTIFGASPAGARDGHSGTFATRNLNRWPQCSPRRPRRGTFHPRGRLVGSRGESVSPLRRCSRTACGNAAVATLTYVYAESTAVLGPLATHAEPHCYDLCTDHSERLTAPRGWEIVRLAIDPEDEGPSSDDLEALANAVREAGWAPEPEDDGGSRRARLRLLRDPT
jgi:Protein of unknown function (DUF3499)